tara:strand:+ start:124 stop:291 length:168 start_codon:yes stop_codon:yes gene_type:complete
MVTFLPMWESAPIEQSLPIVRFEPMAHGDQATLLLAKSILVVLPDLPMTIASLDA